MCVKSFAIHALAPNDSRAKFRALERVIHCETGVFGFIEEITDLLPLD